MAKRRTEKKVTKRPVRKSELAKDYSHEVYRDFIEIKSPFLNLTLRRVVNSDGDHGSPQFEYRLFECDSMEGNTPMGLTDANQGVRLAIERDSDTPDRVHDQLIELRDMIDRAAAEVMKDSRVE